MLNHISGMVIVRPDSQTEADFQAEIAAACAALGEVAMGATVIRGQGYWHPTRQFEDNAIIYSNHDGDEAVAFAARAWALLWGLRYNQQAVALLHDGLALEIVELG